MAGERQIATTITQHIRGAEPAMLRTQRFWAMMNDKGRISFKNSGNDFDWRAEYKLQPSEGATGETPRTFTPRNLWKTATLGWRGLQTPDAITKSEKLANRGDEAIVKVYGGMIKRLKQSTMQNMGAEAYVDGSATGNELRFHGFDSLTQTPTQTYTNTTGVPRTANVADHAGVPIGTYAGLTTALGTYGGAETGTSATTTFPFSSVLSQFDFWTPLIVNYTSSFFAGVAQTWKEQCVEALRHSILNLGRNDVDSEPDLCFMGRSMLADMMNRQDAKERVIISDMNGLRKYGFSNVFKVDSVEISSEYNTPGGRYYMFNVKNIEFLSRQDGLTSVEGPEPDINTASEKYVLDVLGNLQFNTPRNVSIGIALAAV